MLHLDDKYPAQRIATLLRIRVVLLDQQEENYLEWDVRVPFVLVPVCTLVSQK